MPSPPLATLFALIAGASSAAELVRYSQQIPELHITILSGGGNADTLGSTITAVNDAITRRLIQLAEQDLGPPPVPYAWVVAGSQARAEQTSHSDQDNGLIIDNTMRPPDDDWFRQLAEFVSDHLNACGFIYCPGNVMASNPRWRKTQAQWQHTFSQWVKQPRKKSLMYSSIFFDLRVLHGEAKFWSDIQAEMLHFCQNNSLFIAMMASIALHHTPPLGWFNRFRLAGGAHKKSLDSKHGGIIPIVDLARLFALESGLSAISTRERLAQLSGSHSLSATGASDLLAAFDLISDMRAHHQMQQLKTGLKADNYIEIASLTRQQRRALKTAFKNIRLIQHTLATRIGDGLLDE